MLGRLIAVSILKKEGRKEQKKMKGGKEGESKRQKKSTKFDAFCRYQQLYGSAAQWTKAYI